MELLNKKQIKEYKKDLVIFDILSEKIRKNYKIFINEVWFYHPSYANWNYRKYEVYAEVKNKIIPLTEFKTCFGWESRLAYFLQHIWYKTQIDRYSSNELKYRDIKDLNLIS